jgi:hypothetical protein
MLDDMRGQLDDKRAERDAWVGPSTTLGSAQAGACCVVVAPPVALHGMMCRGLKTLRPRRSHHTPLQFTARHTARESETARGPLTISSKWMGAELG